MKILKTSNWSSWYCDQIGVASCYLNHRFDLSNHCAEAIDNEVCQQRGRLFSEILSEIEHPWNLGNMPILGIQSHFDLSTSEWNVISQLRCQVLTSSIAGAQKVSFDTCCLPMRTEASTWTKYSTHLDMNTMRLFQTWKLTIEMILLIFVSPIGGAPSAHQSIIKIS